nr:Transposase IS66 [Methylocystis sp. SC2]
MPDHLPLETITHDAPCVCPTCGGTKFGRIGADEREVLEYVASHFKRVRHVREKMSCRACETIVQAPMPTLPIEKGRPGPALLSHVLVAKYCDHLPLHRQSDIYAREGVAIDRSVMAGWVGHMAALLEPLAERIARHVRAGSAIHADDTTVPVLDPGRGRTKTGRLWTAVRDERPYGSTAPPAAFYLYSADRKSERAHALLKDCRGHLHADGGTVKLTGVLLCSEEWRRRLKQSVQTRFEDWRFVGQLLTQVSVHDRGAHLQHQMSAAL